MTEIWKDIEGYDHKYQVSNLGRVRSVEHEGNAGGKGKGLVRMYEGKILKQHLLNSGYWQVPITLYPNILVHRAVAKAFVPGYFDGAVVNHKDENRNNNRADNLEWVTQLENANYGNHNKKMKETKERLYGCQIEQYTSDWKYIASFPSIISACKALDIDQRNLRRALIEPNRTAKGFHFKRKTN